MSTKKLLSANEAVAYGAAQAGCVVASAYPGTPSTEILENIAKFKDTVNCEWAVNEKVAMETAIGASMAGARSLTAMKHVGLNVAMDPLMTFTFVGATGGMVVNNNSLALEQKYGNMAPEVHKLLKNKQQFPDEKLEEMEKMGFGNKENLRRAFFGTPKDEARWHELHTKMKYDLIGY